MLSALSKIFEKMVHKQLINYLEKFNILFDYQFGFRNKYSTEYAVSYLYHKISEALERREHTVSVFLDLSKAFDTVNHQILCQKLSFYGIRGTALDWFRSYLSDRTQYVWYCNVKSDTLNVNCGVPQGPLLFLLYINDLGYVSEEMFCMLFADDTSLLFTDRNIDNLNSKVNRVLKDVIKWFHSNKLSVNIEKSNYMIFRTKEDVASNIHIEIDGIEIQRIITGKFLGVWFDQDLNWKSHILQISKKISKTIGILKQVRNSFRTSILIQLYDALVYPYFLYCYTTWAITYPTTLEKLVKLQKKIIRIITFSGFNCHTDALFEKFKIIKFNNLDMYLTGILMYKVKHYLVPNIIRNLFIEISTVHNYHTRQVQDFYVSHFRTNVGKYSIVAHGPLIWNKVPVYIQSLASIYHI